MKTNLLAVVAILAALVIPLANAQGLEERPGPNGSTCYYVEGGTTPLFCTQPTPSLSEPPVISVAAPANPVISETDAGGKSFTFTKDDGANPAGTAVTIKYKLSGTAVAGTDYKQPSTPDGNGVYSVAIAAEADTVTVAIQPIADTNHPEGTDNKESVVVTIQDDPSYEHETDSSSATMEIQSVAPAAVTLAATDASALEGSSTDLGNFRVTRAGSTAAPLTVTLTPGGATTAVVTPLPSSVTIPLGQLSLNISVEAKEDSDTGDKTVTLALADCASPCGAAYTFDPAAATVTLTDNDVPRVTIATNGDAMSERGADLQPLGRFLLTRTGATTAELTVNVQTTGTAGDADFDPTPPATLTFNAGQATTSIAFHALQDTVREGTETLTMTVASGAGYLVGSSPSATLSIVDDDVPAVNVTATDAVATEAGATSATFKLQRTNKDLASALTVGVQVTGTVASADYTLAGTGVTFSNGEGTVAFAANQAEATVTLTAVDDATSEGNETATLTIKPAATDNLYGVGSPASAAATVTDNDIADSDADGADDAKDNCLGLANADQKDTDADKLGNACDPDDDNDGLTDAQEATLKTDPLASDTDQDGRNDKSEVDAKTDPLDLHSPSFAVSGVTMTTNGAGVVVGWTSPSGSLATRFLVFRASDPTLVGTVNANAGQTAYQFTDLTYPGGTHRYYVQPMLASQAGNAYDAAHATAGPEKTIGRCEAFAKDTDSDGLCDAEEKERGTDPKSADTDGDGEPDQAEVLAGTDPLEARGGASESASVGGEAPFWVGLVLAVATAIVMAVGVALARRRAD